MIRDGHGGGSADAHAIKPRSNSLDAVLRDPVTGWTFDKFRRELHAARTTAASLSCMHADVVQKLAAAKGGE